VYRRHSARAAARIPVTMTERQAETIANIVIGVAAISAAYYVLKSPEARRTLWLAARGAFAASGPWLVRETRRGWEASAEGPEARPAASTRAV
jgi:hypothetical protein